MATVVLSATPSFLSPVNKEIWYVINSGSSSLTDFKYIVSVNTKNEPFDTTSFTKLQTYKLPPRPISGDAQYSPHRLLRATFDYDLAPTAIGWTAISTQLTQFRLNFGFSYDPGVTYSSTSNTSGFMTLLTLGSTAEFEIGDIITVSKDNKQINIEYDGTCSVVSKPLSVALLTDKPFGVTTSIVESGIITNITRQVGTSSISECYNGTRQYLERTVDFTEIYQVSNNPQNTLADFMTNWQMPYKTIFANEYETLSTILSATQGYKFYIDTYNNNNTLIGGTGIYLPTNNLNKRLDIGVGTKNLELLAGTTSFLSNVDNYEAYIEYIDYLDIRYSLVGDAATRTAAGPTATGIYNGKPYYTITPPGTASFFFWYENTTPNWQVSSALGGGNDWLQSVDAGIDNLPPEGTYSVQYLDGQDGPYFDLFTVTTGKVVTETKKYKIKSNCKPYDPVRLVFINRAGGVDYFTFTLDTKKSINVDRTKYTKVLPFDYSVGMRGDTVLSQKIKSQFVVTSDWLDDKQSEWLEELISSPEVYWLNGTDLLPIVITDTQYQVQTQLRNQTFNIFVTFELAYNTNIQNE